MEIEPTADKIAIQRAYAQLEKKYHQEEQPEEWQRIHDAYEAAMDYAGPKQSYGESAVPSSSAGWESQAEEMEESFYEARIFLQIQMEKRIQTPRQWECILSIQQVRMVRTNSDFLYYLADLFRGEKVTHRVYKVISAFMEDIHQELLSASYDQSSEAMKGWTSAYNELEKALQRRRFANNKELQAWLIFIFIAVIVISKLSLFIIGKWEERRIEEERKAMQEAMSQYMEIMMSSTEGFYSFEEAEGEPANRLLLYFQEDGGWAVSRKSVFEKGISSDDCGVISSAVIPAEVKELTGAEDESLAACFYGICLSKRIPGAQISIDMKEIGIEEGNYQVWQYNGEKYQMMDITVYSDAESDISSYPCQKDGTLYLRMSIYNVNDTLSNTNNYPVVILRTGEEE